MTMTRALAVATLVAMSGLPVSAFAQQPPPRVVSMGEPRFEVRTDVYFYDTDILRDAYAREPYKTTIMLDRVTGQTWMLMKVGESRVVWSAVEFRNSDGKTAGRPQ
ncbi:MAG: hypothetical protein L6R19_14415 [Alphaproteobacteria bacterium]|nr:hypothetical protein [Alphaproteobacteria bacterium]